MCSSQTYFSLLVFAASIMSACDEPTGSGSIDGIALGRGTSLHLENLNRQSVGIDATRLEEIQSRFEVPLAGLDSLRIYTAQTTLENEGLVDLRIAVIPHLLRQEGAYLAVAVDASGVMRRARIWGMPDPETAWENFWRQFEYLHVRTVLDGTETPPDATLEHWWEELQADTTEEGRLRLALYQHPSRMRNMSFLIRRTMAVAGRGDVPEAEWYHQYSNDFRALEANAALFEPLIGSIASAQYKAIAREAREQVQTLAKHAQNGDAGKLRDAIQDFRMQSCGSCHAIEDHTTGPGDLQDAVFEQLRLFDVRQNHYRVGIDVWPVPGEEGASQQIANAIKAVLLLFAE